MKKNLIEYFFLISDKYFSKTAIIEGERVLNFNDLKFEAFKIAEKILNITQDYKQPIAVFLPKSFECIASDIAITMTGNIYTNLINFYIIYLIYYKFLFLFI